jgi:hypothetical protein
MGIFFRMPANSLRPLNFCYIIFEVVPSPFEYGDSKGASCEKPSRGNLSQLPHTCEQQLTEATN